MTASFWAFKQAEEAAEARNHSSMVLHGADDLLSGLKSAETGQRGYLLTGDEVFLEPYLAERGNIGGYLNTLRQLTTIPSARKHLDAVAPLVDTKLAYLAKSIELRKNNNIPAALASVRGSQGKPLMDTIRDEMKGFVHLEEDLLEQREKQYQANMRQLFIVTAASSLLMLLFAIAFAYFIYRESQQRLKNLVHLETRRLLEAQEATNQQLQRANTELQSSKEALRENEERFRLALQNSPIVVFSHDKELRYTWIYNPTLGLTAQQMLGKTDAEMMPVDDAAHLAEIKLRVIETGVIAREEVRVNSNGNLSFYDLSVEPQRDGTGSIIGVTCVAIDITERKASEEATARYARDMGERIKEISCLRDITLLSNNDELSVDRILDGCVRRMPAGWLAPAHTCARIRLNDRTFETPNFHETEWKLAAEIPFATQNSGAVEVFFMGDETEEIINPFLDAERNLIKSIALQFAQALESRWAEIALHESELRWKFAIEGSGDGLWDWNVAGSTVFFSKRWKEMLGFAEDEIDNRLDEWEKRVHPDDKAEIFAAIQAYFDGKMPGYSNEHRVLCKDGSYKWILDRGIVVSRSEDGKPLRMIGTHADVSVRKKTEKLLLDAMQQLQEKEHSRTRFLSAASHDLRQPIAAATLFVETLKLTTPTPDQGELIELLDQSMGVFSGMLERLLDISKFDAGLVEPKIKPIPMTKLFDWLNRTFAQQAIDRQLRFRLFLPQSKALVVRTDIILLQSVLMNLISNALKFTARGGILVSARLRGDRVLLQVWDTGIGIAEADISHVFDEFYQVGNPQRNREGGLGLGLSICQRTMHLLGSEVTCRSHPGRGSVFGISLPLDAAQLGVKPTIAPAPTDEILFSGKRVVVVEDDELVTAGLLGLLRASGAEVRHFINAEEALRHDDFASADYFITDYALGGALTGFQFLEKVQQQRQTPISAVIITGETSAQFNDSVADSTWPVLHKPVSLARLISGLRQ